MSLTYGSVCSGIEAATVAWHPLGMSPAWFCEIEPFPSAVLAHHYPQVPNYGDFTTLVSKDHPRAGVDLLVGGTPCQAFSVAGLRGGLADPRGNLALAFVALVDSLRPRWVVWENVPGVLSSGGGRDFGSFLGALGELGYGWAYRVVDAQYFGLAQRRKRVFVVASRGDWRRAAAVLFEPESLRRDSPPSRETGAGVAGALGTGASCGGGWRVGADEAAANQVVPVDLQNTRIGGDVVGTLDTTRPGRGGGQAVISLQDVRPRDKAQNGRGWNADGTAYTVDAANTQGVLACGGNNTRGPIDVATAVRAKGGTGHGDFESETFIAHTLRGTGHDASEDGTGRGVPLIPVAFNWQGGATQTTLGYDPEAGTTGCIQAKQTPAVVFSVQEDKQNGITVRDTAGTVRSTAPGSQQGGSLAFVRRGVRRLMPHELERLQGFPDGYTLIPGQMRKAVEDDYAAWFAARYPDATREEIERFARDGPRAKALGNSMATTCMAWIGRRILTIDALIPPEPRDLLAAK